VDKLFALLGMIGNTGNDLIFKVTAKQRAGRGITLFYLLQAVFILLCSLAAVLLFQIGPALHAPSIRFGLPVGVITFAVYLLVLKSLEEGEVSINITVFRLNFVVSSILAVVLLGEILTMRKIFGLFLCCAAIVMLLIATPSKNRGGNSGLRYSIPACLLAGGLNILVKTALDAGALIVQLILYRYCVVAVLAALLHLLSRRGNSPSGGMIYPLALLSGTAMMFSLYFTFAALRIGDVALVIPIIQLAFVFSSVGAILIFKEKMSFTKIVAIVLAVASIITIS
jgi:drug/metabolite transporter (DMT)-like permease